MSTIEIMDKGMACLIDNLGEVDAEHFISVMIREKMIIQSGVRTILEG